MNMKITAAVLALACATTIGVTSSADAGSIGVSAFVDGAGSVTHKLGLATGFEQSHVWKVRNGRHDARGQRQGRRHALGQRQGRRHARRHGRRHGQRHQRNFGFAFGFPFSAFAPRPHYYVPAPTYSDIPRPPPSWRFDGSRLVCDYYDAYGRPLCR